MTATNYQVRVVGKLPSELLDELSDMTISVEPAETVLSGELPDQSALVGLISRMHNVGLRLIEIRRLPRGEDHAKPDDS